MMPTPVSSAVGCEAQMSLVTAPRGPRGIVANPGGLPWLSEMAVGLAHECMLRAYLAPFANADAALPWLAERILPQALKQRLQRELRRRTLPMAVDRGLIRRTASDLEAIVVATQRVRRLRRATPMALSVRNSGFDRRVAKSLEAGDSFLVGSYHACLRSFRRARAMDIRPLLDYPIAHHSFADQTLEQEALLQPAFADTIQYHSHRQRKRLDAEIALADRVFVLSSFQKRTFVEAGVDEGKLVITPLGVDIDLFRPVPVRSDKTFRIVFVGQISQRKGISYLLEGFRLAAIANSELLLVGLPMGAMQPWLKHLAVKHLSHVPRWELPRLYGMADVFVLPSLVEGFGLTALEAMACGLPVIVSENTFGEDIVSDGVSGFVIPIRDARSIAERIRVLYEHEDTRLQMGVEARRKAELFSWREYRSRMAAIIDTGAPTTATRSW